MKHIDVSLANLAINADFWDIRIEDLTETTIIIANEEVTTCNTSKSKGAFLRVRKGGVWNYKSTTNLSNLSGDLVALASEIKETGKTDFIKPEKNIFSEKVNENNLFTKINLDHKLSLLSTYTNHVKKSSEVVNVHSRYKDTLKTKTYFNSIGTKYEFDFNQGGFAITFNLRRGDKLFEDAAKFYGTTFDDLKGKETELTHAIEQAREFLDAPVLSSGKYRVLLDPEVAGIFTHESFGHKSEADFMIGNVDALDEWSLGKSIASKCLSIVDTGAIKNSSGYCPIDDEGNFARKNYLIKNGILTGRLHTCETASQLDEMPTANARALGFEWEPIVRMTSTYIEPGKESLEELTKRAGEHLRIEGVKHGSGLSTFTIAPRRAYRVDSQGRSSPVRVAVVSGSVFDTLKKIEGVSSEFKLTSTSLGGCGKNEQWPLPVSTGGPFVLVSEMQVS